MPIKRQKGINRYSKRFNDHWGQLANDKGEFTIPKIDQNHVEVLEKSIDRITDELRH